MTPLGTEPATFRLVAQCLLVFAATNMSFFFPIYFNGRIKVFEDMYLTVTNATSVRVILSTVIQYICVIIHHLLCLFISLRASRLIAHTVFSIGCLATLRGTGTSQS